MMLDKRHPYIEKRDDDPNTYNLGSIGQHNVVIACLPLGRGDSNTVATMAVWMTATFPAIKICMMLGIGSGIPPSIKLGDVVVGVPYGKLPGVVRWQLGNRGEYEKTVEMRHPPSILLSALTKLESIHEMQGSKVLEYLKEDPGFAAHGSRSRETKIHYGLIASTNSPIKDEATRDNLISKPGNHRLLCVDSDVSDIMVNFPCIVIRGICDYASGEQDVDKGWQEPAAAVSAAFAKEVLSVLPAVEVTRLPTIRSMGPSVF